MYSIVLVFCFFYLHFCRNQQQTQERYHVTTCELDAVENIHLSWKKVEKEMITELFPHQRQLNFNLKKVWKTTKDLLNMF